MNFFHFIKLVRWKNLMLVVYIFVVFEFIYLPSFTISHKLNVFQFVILLLAVLFIMAAGYIINDVFDIETDKINGKNNIISKIISIEKAKKIYLFLNTIGISLGVILCLNTNNPQFAFIFFSTPLLLYYYSKKWKTKPLIGNIIISFLVALSAIILLLFDIDFSNIPEEISIIKTTTIYFAIFAFILNLTREICKDIEDMKGDYSLNMRTLPIILGKERTKNISLVLVSIFSISIALLVINIASYHKLASLYLVLIVLLPMILTFYKLKKATLPKHFKQVNSYLKINMFLGINSIIILSINSNVL